MPAKARQALYISCNAYEALFVTLNSTVMRMLFICTVLLLITSRSFCQQTDSSRSLTPQDYLKKSKNQKTAARILLWGGAVVAVGAIILDVNSDWSKSETPYIVAFSTGCASMIGSIPLFVASKRNKRKGMGATTFFEIRKSPVATNCGFTLHSTPTLSVKFNF